MLSGEARDNAPVTDSHLSHRIRTYRWFFLLSLLQVVSFFAVPSLGFPIAYVPYILAIAALTLGLPVAVFFLIVNACGIFIDPGRRLLYLSMIALMVLWLLWAAVTWSFIERMSYLLN